MLHADNLLSFASYAWRTHSLVNQKRALTDGIWKRIRDPLILVLDEEKVKRGIQELDRRQRGRQRALIPFYKSLVEEQTSADARAVFPPITDLITFDSVRPLWVPDGVVVDQVVFDTAKPAILAEAISFVRKFKMAILARMAKAHADSTAVKDDQAPMTYSTAANHSAESMEQLASRVTSVFPCPISRCSHLETYPGILGHIKARHSWWIEYQSTWNTPTGNFDEGMLKTSGNLIQCIRLVLGAINDDPSLPDVNEATTTTQDLDALGACFECVECPGLAKERQRAALAYLQQLVGSPTPKATFMTWSDLVSFESSTFPLDLS